MKNKILIIFIMIVMLVIGFICGSLYFQYQSNTCDDVENVDTPTKINYVDNFNNYEYAVGKNLEMPYEKEVVIDGGGEEGEVKFYEVMFAYGELNKVFKINEKEVKVDGIIKDIFVTSGFDYFEYSALKPGQQYEYVSKLYVLFENGTIGMIDTNDIKNNNYTVKILEEYKDILYFTEICPVNSGGDVELYGVNSLGKAFKIDCITVGM